MRCRPWNKLLLLSSALLGGVGAFAQYSPPATPAPYNPIALAEVTGAPRAAVQAGQNNYQTLSQNPYLGGVPAGKLSATPVALSLEDAVAFGLKQNLGWSFGHGCRYRCAGTALASAERAASQCGHRYGFRSSSSQCEGGLRSDHSWTNLRSLDHLAISTRGLISRNPFLIGHPSSGRDLHRRS